AQLRAALELGQTWVFPDRLKALRLLGKGDYDALEDPIVAAVLPRRLANRVARKLRLAGIDLADEAAATQELEQTEDDVRLEPEWEEQLRAEETGAEAVWPAMVEQEMTRLEALAQAHRQRADADAAEASARLAFDGSAEGERLRRYLLSCHRVFLRTVAAIN